MTDELRRESAEPSDEQLDNEVEHKIEVSGADAVDSTAVSVTPADGEPTTTVHREAAEDVPISGATPARAAAQAAVEELEVEIRDSPVSQEEARNLALAVLRLIRQNLLRSSVHGANRVLTALQSNVSGDYLDPAFWRSTATVVQGQLDETRKLIGRRRRGEYSVESYGMDSEIVAAVRPFATFLYHSWLRVTCEGIAHVPGDGAALLAANHSGFVPWDSAMIATAVFEQHPSARAVRSLFSPLLAPVPLLAPALTALGQVPDTSTNAARLLGEGALVCAFPEGVKGIGKRLGKRFTLTAFDDGFARAALQTGAPVVPVTVVGGEESYPVLAQIEPLARVLRLPIFPVTPLFPWLGALGAVPLPVRWTIVFHAPIPTDSYGADAATDPQIIAQVVEQTRGAIAGTLAEQSVTRRFGMENLS